MALGRRDQSDGAEHNKRPKSLERSASYDPFVFLGT
jgi:hypothetical protein